MVTLTAGLNLPVFLSTLSLRRATRCSTPWQVRLCNFYPRSPCGERLLMWWQSNTTIKISIHALLAESDSTQRSRRSRIIPFLSTLSLRRATLAVQLGCMSFPFLSTLSLRRATRFGRPIDVQFVISIHALLAESDFGWEV